MEGFGNGKKEEGIDAQIDQLLSQLPEKLQEVWEERLEGHSAEEQLALLTDALARREGSHSMSRKKITDNPELIIESPEVRGVVSQAIERIEKSESKIELGRGKAGMVIATPQQEGVCYKISFDEEHLPLGTNDIARETELQDKISSQLDGEAGVMVPRTYGYVRDDNYRAIVMEQINGVSLKDIVESYKEPFPDNFNEQKFFESLRNFVEKMHSLGFYHRDLHEGNVLVHRETGQPCLIDFGFSTYAPIEDVSIYRQEVVTSGQSTIIVLESDEIGLQKMRAKVKNFHTENHDGDD